MSEPAYQRGDCCDVFCRGVTGVDEDWLCKPCTVATMAAKDAEIAALKLKLSVVVQGAAMAIEEAVEEATKRMASQIRHVQRNGEAWTWETVSHALDHALVDGGVAGDAS